MNKILLTTFFSLLAHFVIADNAFFTENKGQLEDRVLYYHTGKSQNIIIYDNGFAYDNFIEAADSKYFHHRVEMRFKNVSPNRRTNSEEPVGLYFNFYKPNIEILKVSNFKKILIKNIYDGIDLVYGFNKDGKFKYDLIVHPLGDISNILFEVKGCDVFLQKKRLVFKLEMGDFEEEIPMSFIKETGENVNVEYKHISKSEFSFQCKTNIKNKTLIIDPQPNLLWATYYGGSQADEPYYTIGHTDGFLYVSGRTQSTGNISTSGAFKTTLSGDYDAFLAKFTTSGVLVWATYYGGSNYETFANLQINSNNEIICAGNTTTSTGLATSGAYQTSSGGNLDGIFVKFNTSGARIWATYFGGSSIDEFYKLNLDRNQNIYFGGKSLSTGLATSGAYKTSNSGGEDALIVSFTNAGTLRWCTYIGGTSQEWIGGVEYDGGEHLYLAGLTASSSGVSFNAQFQSSFGGSNDIFYSKFDTLGKFKWTNYLGNTGIDYPQYLKFGTHNTIFIAGQTTSSSGMTTSGAFQTTYSGVADGYIFSFDSSGRRNWSSYYGGSGFDEIRSIQLVRNTIFIAGRTESNSSISTGNAHQSSRSGGQDNFIMKLDNIGYREWGTYYGGTADDRPAELIWFNGSLYLSGYTTSSSGISTTGAHQTSYGGNGDGFIARFDNLGCGANMYGKMVRPTLCAGDSTGIAAVIMSNSTGNPTFKWKTNPMQYNDTAFGLPAGIYEVVVSDTFGCLDSLKVIISEPAKLRAFIKDSLNISCNGLKNGTLVAGATGGTFPYFYQWQTTPKISRDTISGLTAGAYKVLVTDINNCRDSAIGNISEPDTLKSAITGFNHASCFLLNDGQISVTATGGTKPYNYVWSSTPAQYTSTAYNLKAGYYEVVITDKGNCQTKSSFTITEPSPVTIGVTGVTHSICYNDSIGEIFTNIWGGTPGYKIRWNSDTTLKTNNLSKLKGGTYKITVTDANNCVESKNIVILEPEPLRISFDTVINPLCPGSSDGSISASVGGGRSPYQLFWNAPPYNNVNKVVGLESGLYTLMLKDSVGCTYRDSVRLQAKDSIVIEGTITDPKCYGESNGKISATVKGGSTPYKFSWVHNPSLNSSLLNNIPAGNYYLTVTDKNACINQAQFIVNQPNLLEIKKQLQKDVTCYNQSDGQIAVTVAGGTAPLKINWNTIPASDKVNLNNLKAGVYKITLTDTNGCADSMNFNINEPALLLGFFDSLYSPTCYAQPDGWVTYKANGGIKPYTYSFDNGPFQNDSVATFVKAGWIRAKIIDGNGCVLQDSVELKQPGQLKIDAQLSQISCFDVKDGKIILQASGGVQPYAFQWSHTAVDTHIAHSLNPGTYIVTLKDKNNCMIKDTFQIFQPEKLIGKVDLTIPASCYNVADGLGSGSATGGTPSYEFFWRGPSNFVGKSPTGMRGGNYWMFVKDLNGCLDSVALTIGQPDRVSASVIANRSPSCVDSSDGWAEVRPNPGVGPYTYLWSNGNTNPKAENLIKGNYWVIITDKCGDTAMAYVNISDPAPFIIPNITGIKASFRGNTVTYEIAEVPGWIYNWEVTMGTIVSGQGTSKITVLWDGPGHGNIRVSVINGSRCFDDNFYQVVLSDECMLVYPNPSTFYVNVLLPSAEGNELLQLFDARGRKVFEIQAYMEQRVDISHLADGIYFFRYRDCVIKLLKD